MRKVLALIASLLITANAHAQAVASDLQSLCLLNGPCADYIASNVAAGAVLSNAAWFKGRNQAGNADINILRLDTSDNTVINSSASDDLILQLEDDVDRLILFDAGSDTALSMRWGDDGATAAQNLSITGSTSDADDDQQLCLSGGGACADLTRGSYLSVEGEQDGGGGDAVLAAIDDVLITGNDDVVIATQGAGDIVTIAGGGTNVDLTVADDLITVAASTVLTGGAGSWGWTLVNATDNQACTTGCGISACIFGFDSGAATLAGILACSDDTADLCFCAGAAS